MEFSFASRQELIRELQSQAWDILVIGGGVTGAALARDARLRGLKVALLEADDFASGTSSGSTKLFHGGIRYLENYEFKLVFEAIRERENLEKLYAPFIRPLSFVFPTYRSGAVPRWKLNLGLLLYDSFSFFKQRHKNLSNAETLTRYSQLAESDLTGSCVYADSFAEDYRIVIELIKSSYRNGAICLSRMKVNRIEKNASGVFSVTASDEWSGSQSIQVKARSVFNCSGPFADRMRSLVGKPETLKLTQGIHLIVPRSVLPINEAFVFTDPALHRILFAIPWKSVTYLGTTDTSIQKVEDAQTTAADVSYVLGILNRYLKTKLTAQDVIQTWAAVRPLLKPDATVSNSKISREHKIEEGPENYFDILGGKLTSHSVMAEEVLDLLQKKWGFSKSKTDRISLHENLSPPPSDKESLHLYERYGRFYKDILAIDESRQLNRARLKSNSEYLVSEVIYSIHHEMCLDPIDFLRRRSSLYYETPWKSSQQKGLLNELAKIFAAEISLPGEISREFEALTEKHYKWDREGWSK